jgi:hypothetical protein
VRNVALIECLKNNKNYDDDYNNDNNNNNNNNNNFHLLMCNPNSAMAIPKTNTK